MIWIVSMMLLITVFLIVVVLVTDESNGKWKG